MNAPPDWNRLAPEPWWWMWRSSVDQRVLHPRFFSFWFFRPPGSFRHCVCWKAELHEFPAASVRSFNRFLWILLSLLTIKSRWWNPRNQKFRNWISGLCAVMQKFSLSFNPTFGACVLKRNKNRLIIVDLKSWAKIISDNQHNFFCPPLCHNLFNKND